MLRYAALLLALIFSAGTQAATLRQLSMDEMSQAATSIVRARVTGSSAGFTGSTIYTHYALQVSEIWKGSRVTEAMLPGGVASKYRQSFPGVPQLRTGTEYVLFLWTSPGGITHVVGFGQGMFNVSPQADGTVEASRPAVGESMIDAGGHAVQDHAMRMNIADMRRSIRLTIASGAVR